MNKLLTELRRRNIFRVAGVYAVVGWILMQVAGALENSLHLPDWFDSAITAALLIGFPIAMLLAWAFEMTPEGVKRTEAVAEGDSVSAKTGRTLDIVIVAGLVLVAGLVIWQGTRKSSPILRQAQDEGGRIAQDEAVKRATNANPHPELVEGEGRQQDGNTNVDAVIEPQNSIAVLPFVNMSSDPEQEYFSDGISEELLNVLAQIKGLQVAGRTSSFSFKGKNQDLRKIGEVLNVAHILEGSVRKSGNKVRITAQLVRSDNGFHLWSDTYDRELTDIFAVQDEISNAILSEMREYLPGAGKKTKPTARVDVSAYDLYLLAREKITQGGKREDYEAAADLLDRSIAIDDHYAPALGWRAYVAGGLSDGKGQPGNIPLAKMLPVIKSFADKALAIDENSPQGLLGLASYYALLSEEQGKAQYDQAISTLRKAIAIQPNLSQAANDLAYFLLHTGKPRDEAEAMTILKNVLAKDPALAHANNNYTGQLMEQGRFDEVEKVLLRWSRVSPELSTPAIQLSGLYVQRGDLAQAWNYTLAQLKRFPTNGPLNYTAGIIKFQLADINALQSNPNPDVQAVGLMLAGEEAKALKILNHSALAKNNWFFALSSQVPAQFAAKDYSALAAYYNTRFNTKAEREKVFTCQCAALAYIADTLRETGHKDAKIFMQEWQEAAEKRRDSSEATGSSVANLGWLSAARGDGKTANEFFERAIDLGYKDPLFLQQKYRLPRDDDSAYTHSIAKMLQAINVERAKLDMAPLVLNNNGEEN